MELPVFAATGSALDTSQLLLGELLVANPQLFVWVVYVGFVRDRSGHAVLSRRICASKAACEL